MVIEIPVTDLRVGDKTGDTAGHFILISKPRAWDDDRIAVDVRFIGDGALETRLFDKHADIIIYRNTEANNDS